MDLEGEKKYLSTRKNDTMPFVIVKLDNDEMVETVGVDKIDSINRAATLGIMTGEKENREKGYGTENINLLLDYGFNYLNLNSINLDVMKFNERGIAGYKKCEFKEMGRRKKCFC